MKHYFIQKKNYPRLTLFFAGWGMDEQPFIDYCPTDSDLLICYDYRLLDFDVAILQGYEDVRLIAWSMGVWAASVVLQHTGLPIRERIALNGTMIPVDDSKGIPQTIFERTLAGLNDVSLEKFIHRMCLKREKTKAFLLKRPKRPVAELKEELQRIGEQVRSCAVPDFQWGQAVIGTEDMIFITANQRTAWQDAGAEVVECDSPHYSEEMLRNLLCCSMNKNTVGASGIMMNNDK